MALGAGKARGGIRPLRAKISSTAITAAKLNTASHLISRGWKPPARYCTGLESAAIAQFLVGRDCFVANLLPEFLLVARQFRHAFAPLCQRHRDRHLALDAPGPARQRHHAMG